jgi:KDO2-lipid IV(A) lauroyltransferase
MKPQHLLEYAFFQVFAGAVFLLPLRAVQRLGRVLGGAAYSLWRYRRRIAHENLQKAFPQQSQADIESIARESFRNVGITFLELMWLSRMTGPRLRELVRYDRPELITDGYARGRGILLLTAHYGNWEWLAQSIVTHFGIPVHIIVKTQANPLVDAKINARRTRLGNNVVPMETAIRDVVRGLREGQAIGIVADQAAPKENVPVEFFGRMVPTHQGPAVFSLKMRAPLVAIFSVRQSDGSYLARVREVRTDDLTEYTEENVIELTCRHVKLTEEFIREHPDHWMWMHKRWKHIG